MAPVRHNQPLSQAARRVFLGLLLRLGKWFYSQGGRNYLRSPTIQTASSALLFVNGLAFNRGTLHGPSAQSETCDVVMVTDACVCVSFHLCLWVCTAACVSVSVCAGGRAPRSRPACVRVRICMHVRCVALGCVLLCGAF